MFKTKLTDEKIKLKIIKFIKNNFPLNEELNDDDSFFDSGIIDSIGVLELVAFIEKKFNVKIDDEELIPDNLDSVNKILNFIKDKLSKSVEVV